MCKLAGKGGGGLETQQVIYPGSKINLALDVKGRRPDNFHELEMVMLRLSLSDRMEYVPGGEQINLTVNPPILERDERNLVIKAARLLERTTGRALPGGEIILDKNVPVAAGLGGGSANGAGALLMLNRCCELGLGEEILEELAACLGSDVPFFLKMNIALARGRGEILKELPSFPPALVLLANPGFPLSTADVYRRWQGERFLGMEMMLTAISKGNLQEIAACSGNALEPAAMRLCPDLCRFRERLLALDIGRPILSGSGPTYFLLLPQKEFKAAEQAEKQLQVEGYWARVVKPA